MVPEGIAQLVQAARAGRPWMRDGKVPPVGIDPLLDKAHVEQAKLDADNLGDALKEITKSATRERSPQLAASFIKGITDGEIGIKADAVRELYGDKVPTADDGILGFVPDIAAKLQRAEATGGDIQVSVADYLAKVEPEVHKELADHIRARPEGLTLEESKDLPKPEGEAATPTEPVDAVRQAAGLQGIQDRKLEIKREETSTTPGGDVHRFSIADTASGRKGDLFVSEERGGKQLYVEDITGELGPQTFGPRAMREVLDQIKEQFPNADKLVGMRVSGAREKANKENVKAEIDLTKIKPRAKAPAEEGATQPFAVAPPGFTIEQYKLYLKNIEKRQAQDAEAANARIMKEQRQRQSAEWKENAVKLRPKAVEDVTNQPNMAADSAMREGRSASILTRSLPNNVRPSRRNT